MGRETRDVGFEGFAFWLHSQTNVQSNLASQSIPIVHLSNAQSSQPEC